MDPHNRKEALKECALDEAEGADILMVKPALSYLDVIRECSDAFDLPMCAYSVSGEYAMIKAAGAAGLVDEYRIMCESALSVSGPGPICSSPTTPRSWPRPYRRGTSADGYLGTAL